MQVAGLEIKVERSAVYAFFVLAAIFAVITFVVGQSNGDLTESSLPEVILVAFAAACFHFFAQFVHLMGHAIAARATGYPKRGLWFIYLFGMSLYPADEPPLPARIHIQRSLGGPVALGILLVIVLILWLAGRDSAEWTIRYLTTFMLINNILMFIVSAVFSDGVLFILGRAWEKPADANMPRL